jgi:prepilin signal peptidase PulO-like enzyme (type II secretory pathway)
MSLGGGEGKLNLKRKMLTMKSAIPFAPFLILGTFLALLLQSDLFGIQFFL